MINEIFMEQVEESAKRLEKTLREGKLDNSKTAQGKAFLDVSKNFTIPLIEALEAQPSVEDLFRRSSSELVAIDPKDPEAPARVAATTEGQGRCTVRVSPGGVTGIGANPQKIGRFQRKSRSGIFSSRGARASTSGLRRAPYYVKGAPPNATLSTPFGGLPP
jgi:hypothetical protein